MSKNFWEDAPLADKPAEKPVGNFWETAKPVEVPAATDVDRVMLGQPVAPTSPLAAAFTQGEALGKPSQYPARIGKTVVKRAFDFTTGQTGAIHDAFTRAVEGETQADLIGELSANMAEQSRILSDPNYASAGSSVFNPATQPNRTAAAYSGMGGFNMVTPVRVPSPSERLATLKANRQEIVNKLRETNAILANAQGSTQGMEDFKKAEGWDALGTLAVNLGPILAQGAAESSVVSAKAAVAGAATAVAAGLSGGSSLVVQGAGLLGGGIAAGMESYDSKLMETLVEWGNKTGVDILNDPEGWYAAALKDPVNFEKVYADSQNLALKVGVAEGAATTALGGLGKLVPGGDKFLSKLLIGGAKGGVEEIGTLAATDLAEGKLSGLKDYALAGSLGVGLESISDAGVSGLGRLFTKDATVSPVAAPSAAAPAPQAAPTVDPATQTQAEQIVPGAGVVPAPAAAEAPGGKPLPDPLQLEVERRNLEVNLSAAQAASQAAAQELDAIIAEFGADSQQAMDFNADKLMPLLRAESEATLALEAKAAEVTAANVAQDAARQAPAAPAPAAKPAATAAPDAPAAPAAPAATNIPQGNVEPRPQYDERFSNRGAEGLKEYTAAWQAWDAKYKDTHYSDGTPKKPAPAAAAPAPAPAAAKPAGKPAPSSFVAGLREDAAKLRGQPAAPAPAPAAPPAPAATTPPPADTATPPPAAPAAPAAPSPQPTPAPGANRASFDPLADPRWENLYRDQQKKIRGLVAQRDQATFNRDRASRQGRSTKQFEKRLNNINSQIEEVLAQSQPRPDPVARPDRPQPAPAATAAAVEPDAPKPEPEAITKAKAEAVQIKEQITKLEASGQGRSPQATKLRNRFNLRKADITAYERKNGLPITYPPQPRPKAQPAAQPADAADVGATAAPATPVADTPAAPTAVDTPNAPSTPAQQTTTTEQQDPDIAGMPSDAEVDQELARIEAEKTAREEAAAAAQASDQAEEPAHVAAFREGYDILRDDLEGAAQEQSTADNLVNGKKGIVTRADALLEGAENMDPKEFAKQARKLADAAESLADDQQEKADNIENAGREDTFDSRGSMIDGLNDLATTLREAADKADPQATTDTNTSPGVNPQQTIEAQLARIDKQLDTGTITQEEHAELKRKIEGDVDQRLARVNKEAEDVQDQIATLERAGEGESKEAEALRKKREELGDKRESEIETVFKRAKEQLKRLEAAGQGNSAQAERLRKKLTEAGAGSKLSVLELEVDQQLKDLFSSGRANEAFSLVGEASYLIVKKMALMLARGAKNFAEVSKELKKSFGDLDQAKLKELFAKAQALVGRNVTETEANVKTYTAENAPRFAQGSKEISTRFPRSANPTEDAVGQKLIIDVGSLQSTGELSEKSAEAVASYPNMRRVRGETPAQTNARFVQMVKENLLWLYNQVPADIRNRSKLWYDGANKISKDWAKKYGVKQEAIAGAIAALSPQKDWFQNVALAEYVIKVFNEHKNTAFSQEMLDRASSLVDADEEPIFSADEIEKLRALVGKPYKDLDLVGKAIFTRLHSETYTDRSYHILTPEGEKRALARNAPKKNKKGKITREGKQSRYGWGSLREISKAISCLEDPSLANISKQMGDQHKVRNFYNNIIAPGSADGHVTIDTHAVAAGLIRPLAGKSIEVKHNFGSSGKDATMGVNGTYALYAEAYRLAAAEAGVLPREMQSITWEAIRGMYPKDFKSKKNVAAINAIWKDYKSGKISAEEARQKSHELAKKYTDANGGGISKYDWLDSDGQGPGRGPGGGVSQASGNAADAGELPAGGVLRGSSGPAAGGTGSKPSARVSRPVLTKDGDVANHRDQGLADRGFITNEATKMPADLAGAKLVIEQSGDINDNPNNSGFFAGKVMLNGKQIAEFTYDNASFDGEDNTKLEWVKVVPKHQNKGLSKVIQAEVIERAKRLNEPSQTFSMSVVDPKQRPTSGLRSLLGDENVNDNGPDYSESEQGQPFSFEDPDTGEWISQTNEVTARITNQYTPEQRQLLADIKKLQQDGKASPEAIAEKLDEWAKQTLDPKKLLTISPQVVAAMIWNTARDIQKAAITFGNWSKNMVQTYGPKIKPFLKQIWADSKAIRQNAFDIATVRYLASRADKVWQNVSRNPQSPTLRKLANLLHTVDGAEATGDVSSVPQRIREERIKFSNAWAKMLEPFAAEFSKMTKAQRQQWDADFRDYVLGNKKPTDPKVAKAVAQYRQMMGELLAFQRAAGVEMGDRGGNYYPRVYSPEAIEADPQGFIDAAAEMYRRRDERLGEPAKTDEEYQALASQWAFRIQNGNVDDIQLNSSAVPEQSEMPSSTKPREFTDEEAELAAAYLSKDIDRVTLAYIGRATKAAEVARAFGPKGEKFTQMIAQLQKEGVDLSTTTETAGLVRRTLGYGVERHSKLAASVIDWSNAIVAAGYLGFSFINNILLEPISYGIRTGNPYLGLKAMADTWIGTVRSLSRPSAGMNARIEKAFGTRVGMAKSFNEAMAEQLGLLQSEMERSFLDAHWNYTEENGSPLARWIIQRTQQANLMQQTEHAKVAASVGIARLAIRDNVRFMMGQAPLQKFFQKLGMDVTAPGSSKIILNENGVPEAEHKAFAEFVMGLEGKSDADYQKAIMANDRMAFLYRQAVQRMSTGMSIKSNPALKIDSSDKVEGKFLMQLMNYSYAYANLVKDAMYSKAKAAATGSRDQITMLDRARLAVPLLVGAPLSIIAAEAGKQLVGALWPTEGTEKRDEMEDWRKLFDSASYAGIFGPKVEYLAKLVNRGQLPVGPGLEAAGKTLAAVGGLTQDGEAGERAAKKQIYNAGIKPAAVGGASLAHPFLGFMVNQAMRQDSVRDEFIGEK